MKKILLILISQVCFISLAAPAKVPMLKTNKQTKQLKKAPVRKKVQLPIKKLKKPVKPVAQIKNVVKKPANKKPQSIYTYIRNAKLRTSWQICDMQTSNQFGKQMLNLTNEFRAKNRLPKLNWDQSLANIARVHCIRMAEGKVPFGHAEFNNRIAQYPRPYKSAGENVAYLYGYTNDALPKLTVNGWINSPGHRKNLLGNFNHCAIAGYKNPKGHWYFTQLFALY